MAEEMRIQQIPKTDCRTYRVRDHKEMKKYVRIKFFSMLPPNWRKDSPDMD